MAIFLLLVVLCLIARNLHAQEDYSVPIKCYKCIGATINTTCSDPVNVKNLTFKECSQGLCIKWTRRVHGIWYIERTCSVDLSIRITLIDRVCRTERNGNGYLCMCATHLCNSSGSGLIGLWTLTLLAISFMLPVGMCRSCWWIF